MNYEQFAIWLHGFLEISDVEEINKEQTQVIKDHLALLFEKKTPDRSKKNEDKFPHPYAPMPMPQQPKYLNWQWVPPKPVYCKDTTTPPSPDLGTSVCSVDDKQTKTYC